MVIFCILLLPWYREKLPPFRRRHLRMHFLKWNVWILLNISLEFVTKVRIDNIPTLGRIMAWCRPGDNPLSETMMVSLLTHVCVTHKSICCNIPGGVSIFADVANGNISGANTVILWNIYANVAVATAVDLCNTTTPEQSSYWLWRISKIVGSSQKNFDHLCQLNVERW